MSWCADSEFRGGGGGGVTVVSFSVPEMFMKQTEKEGKEGLVLPIAIETGYSTRANDGS